MPVNSRNTLKIERTHCVPGTALTLGGETESKASRGSPECQGETPRKGEGWQWERNGRAVFPKSRCSSRELKPRREEPVRMCGSGEVIFQVEGTVCGKALRADIDLGH